MSDQAARFQRVEEDDPDRCQAVTPRGQCRIKAIENNRFCPVHAAGAVSKAEKEAARNYRLNQWQARVGEFADNDKVKSLREEVGVLRILLEETMNRCKDPGELILYSNKLSDLVMKIDKVVTSCHRLEAQTGMLLDKQAALHVASVIVNVVSRHVSDDQVLDEISNEIIAAILTAHTAKKDDDK